jgi:hypothetical protein
MPDPTAPHALVELYDHQKDVGQLGAAIWNDFENENVASNNQIVVTALSKMIRQFYTKVEVNRGQPYGR